MSLLSGIYGKPNITETGFQKSSQAVNTLDSSKLQPGQTLTGKVVNTDNNGVTVRLQDGGSITASLDGDMNLQPGQTVTFSVKGNDASKVTLSPLYTNLSGASTAANALMLSGLPMNETTMSMTNAMMSAGMGIDKNALQAMFQQINGYPGTNAAMLVEMTKYGLEISQDNISSFEAFQNYESMISSGINEIMDGAVNLYQELITEGNDADAGKFMSELLKNFLPADNGLESADSAIVNLENAVENQNQTNAEGVAQAGKIILADEASVQDSIEASKAEILQNLGAENARDVEESVNAGQDIWKNLPFGEKYNMIQELKNAGLDENIGAKLLSEGADSKDFLTQVNQLLNKNGLSGSLKSILGSKEFENILKEHIAKEWTLKPEETSKNTIDSLYTKLNQQVKNLTETLSEIAKPDSQMGQSLANMNQNLDFMNQMNQTYQYVQIPLKMNGTDTTGDLFVYTDKKSLANKEGDVSALLHLDMANLGPLDVYASIDSEKHVATKFYLQDEDTLSFIADNIHILNERLEQKGYFMKSEVVQRKDASRSSTPLEADTKPAAKPIAHYSFNALA